MDTISSRLSYLLNKKGLSAYQFSLKIDVSQSTISRILKQNSKPNASTLHKICSFFNISEEWILTGEKVNDEINDINTDIDKLTPSQIAFGEKILLNHEKQFFEESELARKWLELKLGHKEIEVLKRVTEARDRKNKSIN
ncbi:protein of unknown function [Tenacibaculum sp. 190524A02b]|uniref:helix-turn-helix domain-containing protein n=1 Tax=Tenacibaculum vairaonense TaxID=3137860 RepID=UPI0032B20779